MTLPLLLGTAPVVLPYDPELGDRLHPDRKL